MYGIACRVENDLSHFGFEVLMQNRDRGVRVFIEQTLYDFDVP